MTDLRTSPAGEMFSERARRYAAERPLYPIHVLEAGCGWGPGLDLGDLDHRVTGVELDVPGLREHARSRDDLGARHLGDLRTVPMPPRAYDIVHAPYLVERVPHAELVLDRFVAALKPGGLLLLRLRDRDSAYGVLDRTLPLRSPVDAAAPPPASHYDRVASRRGMQWYCVMRGLVIAEEHLSHDAQSAVSPVTRALCRTLAAASRNRFSAAHSDVALIIRKPENRFARVI
ncbi:class I SAM-dependent methyltransferase [Actinomadura flavalba]|uniref:class I SAM-dependent methyltransferase n=1 Tax=Actinomadura flavalba TaxID=1120938 RepID=UPI000377FB05|nr:class I SAM-dependent methyltransferase [Actinomadura flavalba]